VKVKRHSMGIWAEGAAYPFWPRAVPGVPPERFSSDRLNPPAFRAVPTQAHGQPEGHLQSLHSSPPVHCSPQGLCDIVRHVEAVESDDGHRSGQYF
jgi:hypothetical protein